jgi:hypothetical protein
MNIDDPRHPWSRLTAAARRAPEAGDAAAPYGFATRVAALAGRRAARGTSLYERFALRAVGVAGLLAIASLFANFPLFTREANASEVVMDDYDPVAVLMDDAG